MHHMFDSFEGLSIAGPEDIPEPNVRPWRAGDMSCSATEVEANLAEYSGKIIHTGWIPSCFRNASNNRFAFDHIDVDLYAPTRDALKFFYPRLIEGGIMLFDDDGFMTCPGARQAINEFIDIAGQRIIRLTTGQAFLYKRSFAASSRGMDQLK